MSDNGVLKFQGKPLEIIFQVNETQFKAWKIPGMAFMSLIGKIGDGKSDTEQAEMMFDVFKKSMSEEEYARFEEFCYVPSNGVDAGTLFEIISAIVEASAGRPTEPPSSSQSGEGGDGAGSEESSSEKVSQ